MIPGVPKKFFIKCSLLRAISLFCYLFLLCFLFTGSRALLATKASASINAGEQKKAEKGLKDNKKFLYYIDSSISNTGTEDDKKLYTRAIKHDIVARFYYLRFSFSSSFAQIRTAQQLLIELYQSNIDAEIAQAMDYLNDVAPDVVHSRDPRARLYLRLAYRNAEHARIYKNMSDHYKPTLFSMRLYKYVQAMKKAKEAKRYAVCAMLQLRLKDKHHLERTYQSFDDIVQLVNENVESDLKDKSLHFHTDSYYKFIEQSLYKQVWDEPDLETFDPFQKYLELTD